MKKTSVPSPPKVKHFGTALRIEPLQGLAAELQSLRESPPNILTTPKVGKTRGKRTGDVLGFVKGLRLSARLAYFVREILSHEQLEVNWGQLLTANGAACSPECDIIIHIKGHIRRWNGGGDGKSIMDFRFIDAANAKAIISCKSMLTSIDQEYPNSLSAYSIDKVVLFAECCREDKYKKLQKAAIAAGYAGFWCLYFVTKSGGYKLANEEMLAEFVAGVQAAVADSGSSTKPPLMVSGS